MTISLKAARALGLSIDAALLARVDEVAPLRSLVSRFQRASSPAPTR
jgi:hypothetical protein